MALRWEDVQRLKQESGYNIVNIGAELYVLNGYAAVFDAAIAPYLVDQGSTSTTTVGPYAVPQNMPVTVLANPNVTGNAVSGPPPNPNTYGKVFQVGSKVVVDVGPAQEAPLVVLAVDATGLILTLPITNAHGVGGASYPIYLYAGEFLVRDVLARLDIINVQLKGYAPIVAGLAQADEAKFFASQRGRRGQQGVFDDLMAQRDMARRDLCALLGIENLWDRRGRHSSSEGSLTFGRY
jgi:hypothetical protein